MSPSAFVGFEEANKTQAANAMHASPMAAIFARRIAFPGPMLASERGLHFPIGSVS